MTDFFHASRKTGHKGVAARHSAYITRTGSIAKNRPADLVATFSANLPDGVCPAEFWKGADRHLRRNGVAFRSWDIAFPRSLSKEQNTALLQDLAVQLASGRPVEAAFHCPKAAMEGGDQPHGHFMIYDCIPDGIARPLDKMFTRFNPSDPASGGCRKGGATTRGEMKQQLIGDRAICGEVINRHLEAHGKPERVDHRSNAVRNLPAPAGAHLGPSGVRRILKAAKMAGE